MTLLLSLLFVSVLSAPNNNSSNDHLLIEHSVTLESAKNAIQHLIPDLSKLSLLILLVNVIINSFFISDRSWLQRMY